MMPNFRKYIKEGNEVVGQAGKLKELFEELIRGMNQLNNNMIITQENQVEIGKRLESIERRLGITNTHELIVDDGTPKELTKGDE